MKKILIILFCFISFVASAQTYNPTTGTVSNKPYAPSQAIPTDSRSMYFDAVNFLWRPYQSPTEILTYLSNAVPKYRAGNFIMIVDSGGTLNGNGTYTNFHATFYMFADGTADGNLVKLNLYGGGGGGSGTVTNLTATNGSGLTYTITNPTTTPNLSIVTASGGDVSGPLNNISVNRLNGQLPSYYLNYFNLTNTPTIPAQLNPSCVGCAISGSYPNLTWTVTGTGFTTAGYGLKALSASTVAIDSANYRKVDSVYAPNDSTLDVVLNGNLYTFSVRGGTHGSGPGAGTVTNFSFVNANGISGSVTNPTSIPALTLTLGAITPSTVNGLTLTALSTGFTIQGGTTSKTLTVPLNATVSNTNTGDITITGENYLSLSSQVLNANPVNVSGTNITGVLKAASFPAQTGDVTNSAGSLATTISNNAVSNAKLAQMPMLTIKGNNTGGTANAADLTVAQVNAILPVFTSSLNGLVPSSGGGTTNFLRADGSWAVAGTGNPNSNVGTGYRWAIPTTNNIKTAFAGYGVIIDSTSNTNGLTFIVDTTKIAVKGTDSVFIHNVGASGLGLGYTGADTLYLKKLVAGANVTFTQNADSSITINAGGGGTGVTFIGAVNSQAPQANGAIISGDSLYLQYGTGSVPGLISTTTQTIAGAKTFSSAPTFSTLTANGGVFYGNTSGTLLQTNAGTATQVLHGGTSPSFSSVSLTSDVSGILPLGSGGTGTATPGLTAGAGISITGSWPNNTITATTLGTVTSIQVSGGATGLTYSGGPITSSGTITMAGTLVVGNGGTGNSSLTPFAVMAGGSTATGAMQQVSGLGTATQVLTSNGPGALPSWQNATGGGGGSVLTRQNITSGTSATVTVTNTLVQFNFSVAPASYSLTLPASPADQDVVDIQTGPNIAAPGVEITSFTLLANSGQSLNFYSSVTAVPLFSGAHIKVRFNLSGGFWDRID